MSGGHAGNTREEPPRAVLARTIRIERPTGPACGFFVTGTLLLTCQHVLPTQSTIRSAVAVHGFGSTLDAPAGAPSSRSLDPRRVRINAVLDYTAVRLPDAAVTPSAMVPMNRPRVGEVLFVVEPVPELRSGYRLTTTRVTAVADPVATYVGPTRYGSSGAPVFNRRWQLVAIHRKRSDLAGDDASRAREGTCIAAIVADMASVGLLACIAADPNVDDVEADRRGIERVARPRTPARCGTSGQEAPRRASPSGRIP